VHVNEGGQALIAGQFHQHARGAENEKSNDQSHAAAGAARESTALPSPDPERHGMPIPSRERKAPMQDARRD